MPSSSNSPAPSAEGPRITDIVFCGKRVRLACDQRCDKAFGLNGRPRIQLSDDEDDYAFLADNEVGIAPADPGTYEGEHAKPTRPEERHNKWCARECERSGMFEPGQPIVLPNFEKRVNNMPPAAVSSVGETPEDDPSHAERNVPVSVRQARDIARSGVVWHARLLHARLTEWSALWPKIPDEVLAKAKALGQALSDYDDARQEVARHV